MVLQFKSIHKFNGRFAFLFLSTIFFHIVSRLKLSKVELEILLSWFAILIGWIFLGVFFSFVPSKTKFLTIQNDK